LPETSKPSDPSEFDPAEYGRFVAADYDDLYADLDSSAAVENLAQLAAGGPILEFGIGTGRLALPLIERGVDVHGIDGSPEMINVLRRKRGGEGIPVTIGDFSKVTAGADFALVILAVNTVYGLPSQDAQVECFRNAARHLRVGGRFVVEAWVPDIGRFRNGTAVRPVQISSEHVEMEFARIHPANQTMVTTKLHVTKGQVRLVPANHRYAWPCEMDLMARLAGMRLAHRWENWEHEQFRDTSMNHISVWEKMTSAVW
jgi:SAM-dependent methyltransferase